MPAHSSGEAFAGSGEQQLAPGVHRREGDLLVEQVGDLLQPGGDGQHPARRGVREVVDPVADQPLDLLWPIV